MTWPRRFIAVPTVVLRVDDTVAAESPKGYTQGDLQAIAATVPAIYDRIGDGSTGKDLLDMRKSSDPRERQLGETYAQLFRSTGSSNPLAASFNGTELLVDSGNHRIRAAQKLGVPVLPVWVSASSVEQLGRVEDACNRLIDNQGAGVYREVHDAHKTAIGYEQAPSRERFRSERVERLQTLPERER